MKPQLIKKYLTERTPDENKVAAELILSFNDSNRIKWDTLILIMAVWNCIYIPFEIAFQPPASFIIEIINSVIDLFFYIDIAIAFRTSYLTFEGFEVTDWRDIGRRYVLKGTFIFDLLSVLPFNTMTPVSILSTLLLWFLGD